MLRLPASAPLECFFNCIVYIGNQDIQLNVCRLLHQMVDTVDTCKRSHGEFNILCCCVCDKVDCVV